MEKNALSSLSILIVDDDDLILRNLNLFLQHHCRELYSASNGKEAYEKVVKYSPDVLITDIIMPIMDGLTLIEKINQTVAQKPIVVVSTAVDEISTILKAIELGVNQYITKPINLKKLLAKLESEAINIQNKKKLHEEHQYYEALVNNFIVSKTDKEGVITYANDYFCNISGYAQEELIGKSHNIVRHSDMPSDVFKNLWETIKNKRTWKGIVKNKTKSGSFYIVNATVIPILDTDGEIKEFISIREDITELERLREKREKDKEELQKSLAQKKLLEETNRAKDSFLVLFTHELKTPLNAIINFSEYLLKHHKKNEAIDIKKSVDLLTSIYNNGKLMLEHVTNILDIARLKAGKITKSLSLVSLGQCVEELAVEFSAALQAEKMMIEFIADDKELTVVSDYKMLKQILSNLISNSIKYGKDKIRISISADGGATILRVEDNGSGISDKEGVFELFTQDRKHDHSSSGTGVGLYLVKSLCEELHIDIALKDSPSLGGVLIELIWKGQE